jgi:hypothetical protein
MSTFSWWMLLVALIVPFASSGAMAGDQKGKVLLFDFESPADLAAWTLNMPKQDRLTLSTKYVTHGRYSVVWHTPKWLPGMEQWPIWQTTPKVTDWRGYDRLLIDFTNPTDTTALMRFKAVDAKTAKTASGEWPGQSVSVPPRSSYRAILNLDSWMGNVIDRSDITVFLFYTARAPGNYEIHVDNITLLAPGVQPPPLPRRYIQEVANLRVKSAALPTARKSLAQVEAAMKENRPPVIQNWANHEYGKLQATLASDRKELESSSLTIARIDELADDVTTISQRAERLISLLKLADQIGPDAGKSGYLVGTAPATEKVLPRDMPVVSEGNHQVRIGVARNEHESFQVTVVPLENPLKQARVEVSDLTDSSGKVLKASSLDVRVVGYVKTERPEYDVSYVGWWPDPLLDFLKTVDVAPGDAQSFWIRLRAPKNQPAGVYHGKVRVEADGAPPTTIDLTVQVYDFQLPDVSPLPLAMAQGDEAFFKKYSTQSWEQFKFKYADFLSDYYMTYDNIYREGAPDFEIVKYLRDKGTLGEFSLGTLDYTVFTPGLSDAELKKKIDYLVKSVRPGYEEAKKLGILGHSYFYGFDERTADSIPVMKQVTARLKQEFPDVKLMTTALGPDWGPQSGLTNFDVWIPVLSDFNPARAKKVQAEGREVWWYTCQSPAHPYPNVFTEYPAIELRLLLGFMTVKEGSEGFLYYSTVRDQGAPRKAIDTGPFTTWPACAFIQPYNGEGYFMYPGPNGNPLASLRMENMRDGIEDYAYSQILKATIAAVKAKGSDTLSSSQKQWLSRAETLATVPDDLVKDLTHFTYNSQILFDYRQQVADAITSAGISPVYPWPSP